MILFFTEYDQPHESQTNKDIMEAITRKGLGGLCGPDSPDGDGDYQLHDSPRNDSSNQNENEYQARLQNMNALNAGNYDLPFKTYIFLIARLARSDPRNSFLCRPCIFLFVLAFSFSSLHFHFVLAFS